MVYRMINNLGLLGTSTILSVFASIISFLMLFITNLVIGRELTLASSFLAVIIPLIIAPISSYVLLGLLSKLKKANEELEKALEEVKELSGMLPICASCKKVRDDNGYWNQVEEYLSKKTDLKFSHGLCPICYEEESKKIDEFLAKKEKLKIKVKS